MHHVADLGRFLLIDVAGREISVVLGAMNSFAYPRRVDVREARATARSGGRDYVCRAHSITILRLTAR